jgi:hypothetical protein
MSDEKQVLSMSRAELQEVLAAAISAARQPDPLQAKKIAEETERQRRLTAMQLEMGRIEQEAMERKRNSCSHKRAPSVV